MVIAKRLQANLSVIILKKLHLIQIKKLFIRYQIHFRQLAALLD